MALRIAFDLDGVLADMESAIAHHADQLFGDGPLDRPPEQASPDVAESNPVDDARVPDRTVPATKLQLTVRQQRRLWKHIETVDNFWETLDEIEPGSTARLAALAVDRRWEIIFLTKRPENTGATAQVQSQRWLESRGFALPSVYVVQGSRGRIAAALDLDIVVDDRPENCLDVVVDSKARAILVWREDETQLPVAAKRLGIGIVKSVAECLDILARIDSTDREPPGFIDRVKRLLGLNDIAHV